MTDNKEEKKLTPPYLSYKTFDNFLQRLKISGIPSRIDRSVLGSYYSGSNQILILTSLRYLNLTNDQGEPNEKLEKLVKSAESERKKILKEILVAAYPFIFQDKHLNKITFSQIKELFIGAGTQGETAKKSIRFFIAAARDAEVDLSPYLKKARISVPRKIGPKTKHEDKLGVDQISTRQTIQGQGPSNDWQQLLLSKFPTFDPAWSDEVKKEWFAGFSKLMEEFKK